MPCEIRTDERIYGDSEKPKKVLQSYAAADEPTNAGKCSQTEAVEMSKTLVHNCSQQSFPREKQTDRTSEKRTLQNAIVEIGRPLRLIHIIDSYYIFYSFLIKLIKVKNKK